MADSIGSSGCVPYCVDAAVRASLVMRKGSSGSAVLKCRRIVTLIGARPGCRMVLKHRHVEPVHVAIVNDGQELHAIDLVTHKGTRLNGLPMEHERLSDGDLLSVAHWEFRVDLSSPTAEPGDGSNSRSLSLDPTPTVVALEHLASSRILKPTRNVCIIGRRKGCDISLSDKKVSRVHALIMRYFGQPVLVDLLSRHHLVVNDEQVVFHPLCDGDIITVGGTKFRARLLGATLLENGSNGHTNGTNTNGKAKRNPAPRIAELDQGLIQLEPADELPR